MSWAESKGKYANGKLNSFHKHQRQQIRFYVLFLASTGIQKVSGTETRFMRWEDIDFGSHDADGKECLKIRIRSKSKRGTSRTVISQANAVEWMGQWKAISHYNGDQDYVWYGMSKKSEKQKITTDLNKTFKLFLKSRWIPGDAKKDCCSMQMVREEVCTRCDIFMRHKGFIAE